MVVPESEDEGPGSFARLFISPHRPTKSGRGGSNPECVRLRGRVIWDLGVQAPNPGTVSGVAQEIKRQGATAHFGQ